MRTYQDMERTLDNVKKRMKKLKKIQELYQRVQERIEKDRMYEYFLKRSDLELVEGQLSSLGTGQKERRNPSFPGESPVGNASERAL